MTCHSRPHVQYLGSRTLAVRGRLFSTISVVGVPYWSRSTSNDETVPKACVQDWMRLIANIKNSDRHGFDDLLTIGLKLHRALTRGLSYDWIQHLQDGSPTPPETNDLEALDHCLMTLFLSHFAHIGVDYEDLYVQSTDDIGDGRNHILAKFDTFADFVFDNAVMERFVVDASGRFGFAPATAQEGDAIVEFEGSKTLYVLRTCRKRRNRGKGKGNGKGNKKPGEATETYQLLGPAYLGDDEVEDEELSQDDVLSGPANTFDDLRLGDYPGAAAQTRAARDVASFGALRDFVLV